MIRCRFARVGEEPKGISPLVWELSGSSTITRLVRSAEPHAFFALAVDRTVTERDLSTGAMLSRRVAPEGAIDGSLFVTTSGALGVAVLREGAIDIVAVDDGAVWGSVSTSEIPLASLPKLRAMVLADLSRMVVAGDDWLTWFDLGSGEVVGRFDMPSYEPEIVGLDLALDGSAVRVRYDYLQGDILPSSSDLYLDAITLRRLDQDARTRFAPFADGSPLFGASRELSLNTVSIVDRHGRLLVALGGHAPWCTSMLWVDERSLITGDGAGFVRRWEIDPSSLTSAKAHASSVVQVLSIGGRGDLDEGRCVSVAQNHQAVFWRHGESTHECAVDGRLSIDLDGATLLDRASASVVRDLDGRELSRSRIVSSGRVYDGVLGHSAVAINDTFPNEIVSLQTRERMTFGAGTIISSACPPIFHPDGRHVLVATYTDGERLWKLDPIGVIQERRPHDQGTCWMLLLDDRRTLLSVGYADGLLLARDFFSGEELWRVVLKDGSAPGIKTCAYFPRREAIAVVDERTLTMMPLRAPVERMAGRLGAWVSAVTAEARRLVGLPDVPSCRLEGVVVEVVADADERHCVVYFERSPPKVVDVDSMSVREPSRDELARASVRRRLVDEPHGEFAGLERVFRSTDDRWIVGWGRAIQIHPQPMRPSGSSSRDNEIARELRPMTIAAIANVRELASVLVDDLRGRVWLTRTSSNATLAVSLLTGEQLPLHGVDFHAPRLLALSTRADWIVYADEHGAIEVLRAEDGALVHSIAGVSLGSSSRWRILERELIFSTANELVHVALDTGSVTKVALPSREQGVAALALAFPYAATLHDPGSVWLWDLAASAPVGVYRSPNHVTCLDITAGGDVIAGDAIGNVMWISRVRS